MSAYTHRTEKTVRDNQLIGNIRVSSRKYCTGRVDVNVMSLIPSTGEQAAQLGFSDEN